MSRKLIHALMLGLALTGSGCFLDSDDEDDETEEGAVEENEVDVTVKAEDE